MHESLAGNFIFAYMWQKVLRFIAKAILWFLGLTVLWVIIYRWVPVPFTYLMLQRSIEQKLAGRPVVCQKDWEPLSSIDNELQLAVVCAEDQNFLWHHGFDLEAIEKAMKYNEKQKKRKRTKMRGASTISQQTAKNTFLFPQRSFIRKGLEVYFTALIELLWSKERILEVYLNVIEFGNGIYGAEAASQHFFKKPASRLTQAEAARLAAVLPAPLRYNAGSPSAYVARRQGFIQRQMNLWGGKLDFNMPEFGEDEK